MIDFFKKNEYDDAVSVLINDGVVLAPSDTVLGLFAQLSEKAKSNLDNIKIRNQKPYIVLVNNKEKIFDFIDQEIDENLEKIMSKYWPGPLTIIFKAKATLPSWMKSVDGTIAIRVPDNEKLQYLLQNISYLFTTSANISDQPLPLSYHEIDRKILEQVFCCDIQLDTIYNSQPSTIINYSSGSIQIIRLGAIDLNSI
ncbi:MAG: L-threonylcarbamoyladenylate synthase [Candidatus Chromulinivorax sp.]